MVSDASLISGSLNFRDTGGLPAGDRVTRHGVLFRSGNLVNVDDTGLEALAGLGLRRIVDLRGDYEVRHAPSRVPEGIVTQRVPLFAGSVDSFFVQGLTLRELYAGIVEDSADRVVEVVRAVIAEQPVLVHCTVGKDRTGVTVAMTLSAAGVDDDAVVNDYARTEGMLPAERNARVVSSILRALPGATTAEELATKSPAGVMRDLLGSLRERYGAPVEYLRAHGLADDEIAELRRVLLA
ncbi:tyrosine-protein phosphatase [uncultured Microbacterium sp.]|uniref:tyrosine-protein phosphatase n=1 Tax=uncultured Microbacterium sp. TaxID=191216 RepID=UPI0025FE51CE|nr:tyrosine-protein phosphatase [uncultured Microbacterium sp.]